MAKNTILITPTGVANYPYITKPDTDGKFADGKYKTKLNVTKEALAKFQAEFEKAVGKTPKGYKVPWGEKDGQPFIIAKSKYQPKIEYANGDGLEEGQYISGGSKLKLAVEVYDYDKGYSLRLKGVKVMELVTGGSSSFFGGDEEDDSEDEKSSLDI